MRSKRIKSNLNKKVTEKLSKASRERKISQKATESNINVKKRSSPNNRTNKSSQNKGKLKKAVTKVNEIKLGQEIIEGQAFSDKTVNNKNKQSSLFCCLKCSRIFKSPAGLRRHESICSNKTSCSKKEKLRLGDKNIRDDQAIKPSENQLVQNGVDSQIDNKNEEVSLGEEDLTSLNAGNIRARKRKFSSNNRSFDPLLGRNKELISKVEIPQPTSETEDPIVRAESEITIKDEETNNEHCPSSQPKCNFCNRVFKTYTGVRRHEVNCKKKNTDPLSIEVAQEISTSIKVPEVNERTKASPDSPVQNGDNALNLSTQDKCDCCGEDLATAHLLGDFKCKECSKLFRLKSSLERHTRVAHNGESHECPQCGAKSPDKGTLARHMYTHTGLKPYSCPVCKQEFSRKYHIVRHNMQTGCDGKEKPVFPCQVCGREFNRKDNLREHLRAHAGQTKKKKKFTCQCCGVDYPETDLLKSHKKTHSAGERQYVCDFCPKKFPSSGAAKKHRRTHTGERPYECGTCLKTFAAKETLNRHLRIHTGYKPHCCQYCGKSFIQSSQLKSHLYYHTGQSVLQASEAYVCDLCGKKFNRKARLNEHVKYIHLGAKPFECEECNKTFIRKEDLNRHRIIHSGIKAHQCPICSKSFAMKSALKVHLLTHTKEPPSSCDACGRAFIRQDCLLRHMRNKHREMLEEIKSEAEKKKLQQQLLQVAAEASLVEGMEEREELDENGLIEAVRELLTLLVDETTLRGLGWPDAGVEALLEAVIRRCGHEPAPSSTPRHDRLRHNVKLLFTVVIDDSAVKALLNNQTVDEVILHVLRLAKS